MPSPHTPYCKVEGCLNRAVDEEIPLCFTHHNQAMIAHTLGTPPMPTVKPSKQTLAELYPKYYKPVGELTEVDVYAVHKLFNIQDPSGAIQHASKKLLLAGVRTGSKSTYKDIKEARDTLNRWLELYPES